MSRTGVRCALLLIGALVMLSSCSYVVRREYEVPLYVEQNARDLVKLVNRYRERHGLEPLKWDGYLYMICWSHCQDMREREYFSHYSPEYQGPFERLYLARVEYVYAGENLAHGQTAADKVLADWLRSPAHKRNIESVLYTHHAVAYDPVDNYWTHMFINYGLDHEYMISDFRRLRHVHHRILN